MARLKFDELSADIKALVVEKVRHDAIRAPPQTLH